MSREVALDGSGMASTAEDGKNPLEPRDQAVRAGIGPRGLSCSSLGFG